MDFIAKVWKSVIRHGFPDTNRNRALTIFSNFFLHLHPVKISKDALKIRHTFCLGGLTFAMFLILTVSGILLMLYYRPSPVHAYEDMLDLKYIGANGIFLRNLHRWSAHAMVACVFFHMLKVFYKGAYRPPKQFNWVIGVVLLLVTFLLSYTGYLLPGDQLAFWGVSVGIEMARTVPLIGDKISYLLLGGREVGANALVRFYVLHCALLPVVLTVLCAVHFWRVRKDGGALKGL